MGSNTGTRHIAWWLPELLCSGCPLDRVYNSGFSLLGRAESCALHTLPSNLRRCAPLLQTDAVAKPVACAMPRRSPCSTHGRWCRSWARQSRMRHSSRGLCLENHRCLSGPPAVQCLSQVHNLNAMHETAHPCSRAMWPYPILRLCSPMSAAACAAKARFMSCQAITLLVSHA